MVILMWERKGIIFELQVFPSWKFIMQGHIDKTGNIDV